MRRSTLACRRRTTGVPRWSTTETARPRCPTLHPLTGLVLTGGGARAAYQVGVLKALAADPAAGDPVESNPFPVISGTSAGAINAAALACRGRRLRRRGRGPVPTSGRTSRAEQVYRADSLGVIRTGARWLTMMSIGWVIARWRRARPRSLLDNQPLDQLLKRLVDTERLQRVMRDGHLQALAITASSYGSGLHVTFYDAVEDIVPWTRSQRHRGARRDHGARTCSRRRRSRSCSRRSRWSIDGHIE